MQRLHRLTPRFSDAELLDVHVAAVLAGLTPTGYVAKAAVDLAAERVRPAPPGLVDGLGELLLARRQVQRFGVLVNQAVAKWHATDVLPEELLRSVALVSRVLGRLEDAGLAVRQAQDAAASRQTRRLNRLLNQASEDADPALVTPATDVATTDEEAGQPEADVGNRCPAPLRVPLRVPESGPS